MDQTLLQRFVALFTGLDRAYGTYVTQPDNAATPGEKVEGTAETHHNQVSLDLYEQHLAGESPIGIIPITDEGNVHFAAIDIDDYSVDHITVFQRLAAQEIPLVPCRSKSGGLHIYAFNRKPYSARLVQGKLREIAANLGYPQAEVFPKQTRITREGVGNWINLPFFGADDTTRYGYDVDSGAEIRSLEQWLTYAESRRIGFDMYKKIKVKEVPAAGALDLCSDGPPCLQAILGKGVGEGQRNTVAFNFAVYAKTKHKGDESEVYSELIAMQREHMDPGLSDSEVGMIVRNAMGSSDTLRYQCSQSPLKENCNRQLCNSRKYGIGLTGRTYDYGTLWHVVPELDNGIRAWDDCSWRLQVTLDGVDYYLELSSEELFKHHSVVRLALNRGMLLPRMSANDWHAIIEEKVLSKQTEIIPEEYSSIGELRAAIVDMLDTYARATEKRLLRAGQAWHNEEDEEYWVMPSLLARVLKDTKTKRPMKQTEKYELLKQVFGAKHTRRRLAPGEEGQAVYIFPESKLPDLRIRKAATKEGRDDP